jgi:hypothetical protein
MTEQISLAEYRKLLSRDQHKYGAAPTHVDNVRFDSQAEAARYAELILSVRAGEITDLVLQPSYVLQDAFRDRDGRRHAAIRYVADFAYVETVTTVTVVEDVKGARTAVYLLKAKLFRFHYPQLDYRVLEAGRCRATRPETPSNTIKNVNK